MRAKKSREIGSVHAVLLQRVPEDSQRSDVGLSHRLVICDEIAQEIEVIG